MAGIVTTSTRDGGSGCNHLSLVVDLDGESVEIKTGEHDPVWQAMLTTDEKRDMLRLLARWWKVKGGDLAAFVGRVLAGEEATNVKQYGVLTKDVTKTNIGTSYVNVPPGANGERTLIEFTGCTEFRIIVHAVMNGTGTHRMRIVRDSDDAVLYESANIAAQAGEREFDTGVLALPAAATGLMYVRFQALSSVGSNDPIYRRCILMVK